ncbi:hypothetical protein FRC17_010483 [Serendipita sp. 399]|nr:hypothetical protein FRC17_010483 [Serendipita sp. 399]
MHLSVPTQASVTTPLVDAMPLIESFQQSILDLSRTLDDTIRRYSLLLGSLMSSSKRTTPSLPNETIVDIFRHLVADGSHRLEPLLLVNKRFHALVMSTPSLWCNIVIKFDATLRESSGLSARYIHSCIERSQNFPLDVNLKVTATKPSESALSILQVVKEEVPRFSDAIEQVINVVNGTDGLNKAAFFGSRMAKLDVVRDSLAGKEGIHMNRWRSLKFSSPPPYIHEDYDAELDVFWRILRLFKFKMPNLETFTLDNSLLEQIPMYYDFFPDLSAVVDLPSLRKLTLRGEVCGLKHFTFWTPTLESLTLDCGYIMGIPKVPARLVVWTPIKEKNSDLVVGNPNENHHLESMVMFLQHLIGEITGMEELVVKCGWETRNIAELAVHALVSRRHYMFIEIPLVIRVVSEGSTVDMVQIQ